MFYRIGGEADKDIWVKKEHCPRCKVAKDFHLYKSKFKVDVCWIPMLRITTQRALVCEGCMNETELTAREYGKIRREQYKKLKKGEFPDDVVFDNYSPKEIGFVGRIIKLIIVALWSCQMVSKNEWDLSKFYILFLTVILPCVLTIKNSIPVFKKRKAYKKLIKKYKKENIPLPIR